MIFFLTHNANQLKCCCNSLTFILHAHGIDPSASIVVQFPPYFHKVYFLLLSFIQSDFAVWEWDVLSLSNEFRNRVLSGVFGCSMNLHCHAFSFVLHLMRRKRVGDREKRALRRTRSLVGVLFQNNSHSWHLLLNKRWLYVTYIRWGSIFRACLAK